MGNVLFQYQLLVFLEENKVKFSSPALPLGIQVLSMSKDFPGFYYRREKNIPTWYGYLKPFEESNNYFVKVEYRFDNQYSKRPHVWVLSPELVSHPPHIYPDRSLCLFFPSDETWTPYKNISKIIVPLTATWLGFYEIWLSTKVWYGPEAPHTSKKK